LKRITSYIIIMVLTAVLLQSCGGNKSKIQLTARESFDAGMEKYENKKYLNAIEKFQSVIYNFPGDAVVDSAQYYLGMSYYHNDDFELAGVEFNRLAVNYPSSEFFDEAVFMKAVSFFEATPGHYGLDQSELTMSIGLFNDYLIDFPESEYNEAAREYLLAARSRMAEKYYSNGVVYQRIRAYKAAQIYFQKVIDDYTDTEFAPNATFNYALMDLKLLNYKAAQQKFNNFITVFSENELVEDARKYAAESAFNYCKKISEDGLSSEADSCWNEFRENYPNDNKIKEADKLLQKLKELNTNEQGEHAGT